MQETNPTKLDIGGVAFIYNICGRGKLKSTFWKTVCVRFFELADAAVSPSVTHRAV